MEKKVEIWQQSEEVLPIFLIEISPEIRTPLTAILGYVDILLSEQEGDLTPKQTKWIAGIRQGGLDLLEMFTQHLDDGTYDRNSLQFRTSLASIWGYTEILLDGQAGPLNERQVRFLVGLRENTQSLHETFEYVFDMYGAATGDLLLKIGGAIDISQLIEQISPDEIELRMPQQIPKIHVDEYRVRRAITGLFDGLYAEDTIVELTYDDLWIRFDIFTKREVFESDYFYPNPGLFYGWRIIEMHGGQITYELKENGTQLHCFLPIFQNKPSN